MAVFTKRIISTNDDAEEKVSDGSMDLSSSDLELNGSLGGTGIGYVGMRWTNVTIPQGATIDSAKIQFHVDEVFSNVAITVTFRGEDIDNAPAFSSTASDISNRTETTASVGWAVPDWVFIHDEGSAQLSTELKTIVQEIVDRVGWVSGNALIIMIKAWSGTGERTAESYDGEAASAPELQITYTPASTTMIAETGSFVLTGNDVIFTYQPLADLSFPVIAITEVATALDVTQIKTSSVISEIKTTVTITE